MQNDHTAWTDSFQMHTDSIVLYGHQSLHLPMPHHANLAVCCVWKILELEAARDQHQNLQKKATETEASGLQR